MAISSSDPIKVLREKLLKGVKNHSTRTDSFLHNGGTAVALAATATATVLPVQYSIWARVASAVATFVIAVARALDFGARWRWHLAMQNKYQTLLDCLDLAAALPETERAKSLQDIYQRLSALRARENTIPGSGLPAATDGVNSP